MVKRPARLASASAYYRLAAKADRQGNSRQATQYRAVADQLVATERREREARQRRGL